MKDFLEGWGLCQAAATAALQALISKADMTSLDGLSQALAAIRDLTAPWSVGKGDKCMVCKLSVVGACLPCEFKGCERHMQDHENTDGHQRRMPDWVDPPEES